VQAEKVVKAAAEKAEKAEKAAVGRKRVGDLVP
jgi:hypothetical protein